MHKLSSRIITGLLLTFFVSCDFCSLWGSHELGGKFILLDGDSKNDRSIIYCTGHDGCCNVGIPLLPSALDSSGLSIEKVKYDKNWIVTKTINKHKAANYWIINKNNIENLSNPTQPVFDSVVRSSIVGPLTKMPFTNELKKLHIDLTLE